MSDESRRLMFEALNRLRPWRSFFAARHGDPNDPAFVDFYEKWMLLRVETSAVSALLIERKIVTPEEFHEAMLAQAETLDEMLKDAHPRGDD